MSQIHPDQQKVIDFLQDMAKKLIEKQAFFPTGASLDQSGQMILEYIEPTGNGFETRKKLHAKLVEIAKGGRARAVGLCHSLENPQIGTAVVICVDHIEAQPVTMILPFSAGPNGEVRFTGDPILQGGAYAFFRFVRVADAQRLLPGRWKRVATADGPPEEVEFGVDQSWSGPGGKGSWKVGSGDFFTMLLEEAGSGPRQRRVNELTDERLVVQEVEAGMVRQAEYSRLTPPPPPGPAGNPGSTGEEKPWWKFW